MKRLLAKCNYNNIITSTNRISISIISNNNNNNNIVIKKRGFNLSSFSSSSQEKEKEKEKEKLSLIERISPPSFIPYIHLMRLHRPIGSYLLFFPTTWSCLLATSQHHLPIDYNSLLLFGLGAVIMRGAGCTINDLWDRDIDAKVERTKMRPLAAKVISVPSAIKFLGLQLLTGLGVLLQFNHYTIALAASSLGLITIYPLMKRVTHFPQAVLGLTMNWGALVGYSAVTGYLDVNICAPLYIGSLFWTLHYDTIYGHQDKKDDVKVGVKSTSLRFGENTKPFLTFCSIATIAGIGSSAYDFAGIPFYLALTTGAAHLAWQIKTVNLDDPKDCMRIFVSNKTFGAIIMAVKLFHLFQILHFTLLDS